MSDYLNKKGKSTVKKIAFLSSFLPRKCGIATFTADLITNVSIAARDNFEPLVVAMRSENNTKFNDPVKFEIRQNVKNDYICAADYINFSHVEALSVQHEFGLFGGDAGSYLTLLLERLSIPIITTLHTILDEPDHNYYKSMVDLCNASDKLITMNQRGIEMLQHVYGIHKEKIMLIPHGIPDLSFVDNNYYKHKFSMEDKKTILTFGLLNKNKGIEVMLKAMPAIVRAEPNTLYIVLGTTHPSVLKHDGESYRFTLQQIVKELGLAGHVIFHNRFVNDEELHNFLCATDIYVTPYLNKEQLTSGTLSFAVGAGKAVVSTPYWAATELLSNGRGILVPFGDSAKTAEAIIKILKNEKLFYGLRRKAYEYSRNRTWPKIGQRYWRLFNLKKISLTTTPMTTSLVAKKATAIEIPEPSLGHLKKLTDETGILQHAKFTIPDLECGYCTDDNARAVIVMAKYYAQYSEPRAHELLDRYLSFIIYAQKSDGTVRNFMNFERTWFDNEPLNDALGRTLWALGALMANLPDPSYLPLIKDRFDRSVKHIDSLYLRGMAYSILGMSDYLKMFPGASDIKRQLEIAADKLVKEFEKNSSPPWQWFEDRLTYDNAILPHALFMAGVILGDKYIRTAETACKFLLENTFTNQHFSFIGSKGWYIKEREKAAFDQQPIEVASTILMLKDIYDVTKSDRYLLLQRKAFDWFLGENDLHLPVYNFRTKGCHDGLMAGGVNANQGAESIISFLLSLLAISENYSVIGKISEIEELFEKAAPETPAQTTEKTPRKPGFIKAISKNIISRKNSSQKFSNTPL